MSLWQQHGRFERHSLILILGIIIVVSIGGLVEIAPLFWIKNTIEPVRGVRPYTPLELAGREIYVREGCYTCHSQMIRPLRDEVERYGHYSLAAESMYDRPFLWGSKRTGPDLARVGNKYSDDWQREHLMNPRAVVPESIMPPYAFLASKPLRLEDIGEKLSALTRLGVPYTQAEIDNAAADARAQADPDNTSTTGFRSRYGAQPVTRNFDSSTEVTEMDALIAYLQMLGTTVDFSTYRATPENQR